MAEPIVFLHLSDLHVAPPGQLVHGIDAVGHVRRVLDRARRVVPAPAFVVVSGDLSEDGSPESYEVLRGVLGELGAGGAPVLLALGNHDDRAAFRRVVLGHEDADGGQPYCHSQTIDGLRLVVLDSVIPGETAGELGAAQLAWLEETLRSSAPRGTLIALHHPCRFAGPVHHAPDFILRDAAALEAVVARHRGQIVGVLAGHSHQANAAPFAGTLHATAPAVLAQLDFFAGAEYAPVPGAGFTICQLDDAGLVASPVLLSAGD